MTEKRSKRHYAGGAEKRRPNPSSSVSSFLNFYAVVLGTGIKTLVDEFAWESEPDSHVGRLGHYLHVWRYAVVSVSDAAEMYLDLDDTPVPQDVRNVLRELQSLERTLSNTWHSLNSLDQNASRDEFLAFFKKARRNLKSKIKPLVNHGTVKLNDH